MESVGERQYQQRLAYSLGLLTDLDYNQLGKEFMVRSADPPLTESLQGAHRAPGSAFLNF